MKTQAVHLEWLLSLVMVVFACCQGELLANDAELVSRKHLMRSLIDVSYEITEAAYEYCHQNQLHTAKLLGVSRNIIRARLIKHGLLSPNTRV